LDRGLSHNPLWASFHTYHEGAVFPNKLIVMRGTAFYIDPDGNSHSRHVSLCTAIDSAAGWSSFAPVLCAEQNILLADAPSKSVCVENCNWLMRVFITEERAPDICQFHPTLEGQTWSCQSMPYAKGMIHRAGLFNSMYFNTMSGADSLAGRRPSREGVLLSQSSSSKYDSSAVVTTFMANNPEQHNTWLSQMRFQTSGTIRSTPSTLTDMRVQLTQPCTVENCMGCQGSVQTVCYMAQQCAYVSCIGTQVNLQKPLCAVGSVGAQLLEASITLQSSGIQVLAEIIANSIDMAIGNTEGTYTLEWIDDVFYTNVCESKDIITSLMGAFASTINALIELFNTPTNTQPDGKRLHDHAEASTTLIMSSVTQLMSNIMMWPMYQIIAVQKVFMCFGNTMLIVVDDLSENSVRIGSVEFAKGSDAAVGVCLTAHFSEQTQYVGVSDKAAADTFGVSSASIFGDLLAIGGSLPFEGLKHLLDTQLSWLIGLVKGVQDVIQTSDVKHCKLPDFYAQDAVKCACGDIAVQIPALRATERLDDAAFWCTGTLLLTSSFGTPYLVYNPYTYAELLRDMADLDDYLNCISQSNSDCSARMPGQSLTVLTNQGVSPITVFVRCKSNYNNLQWDEGAAALFAESEHEDLVSVWSAITEARVGLISAQSALVSCMRQTLEFGGRNYVCQQEWLQRANVEGVSFFHFEDVTETGNEHVAACRVFTGPANMALTGDNDAEVTAMKQLFSNCTVENNNNQCDLQHTIWSGRSNNKVHVGQAHVYGTSSKQVRVAAANAVYSEVSLDVKAMLDNYLVSSWSGEDLAVNLFTTEGDLLHQAFDCGILGPYGSADLWPSDVEGVLSKMVYARDASGKGDTRAFDLPCTGAKLQNDLSSPFTCGSSVRRSIIKTFVRSMSSTVLHDAIASNILDMLDRAASLYADAQFGCECLDNSGPSASCCEDAALDELLPSAIRNFNYVKIGGDVQSTDLMRNIFAYIDTLWVNSAGMQQNNNDYIAGAYNRSMAEKTIAVEEALFDFTKPIVKYSVDDVDSVFGEHRNKSLWHVCWGVLSQVFVNVPMADDSEHSGKSIPRTLRTFVAFNAMDESLELNVSTLENYVERITLDAWQTSPFYWSHVLKHAPSESNVCEQTDAAEGDTEGRAVDIEDSVFSTADVPTLTSFSGVYHNIPSRHSTLGRTRDRCYCGWYLNGSSTCQLPAAVCSSEDVMSVAPVAAICESPNRLFDARSSNMDIHNAMRTWWNEQTMQCPDLYMSEAWGGSHLSAASSWLTDSGDVHKLSVRDILLNGGNGVRIGNVEQMSSEKSLLLNPKHRTRSLYHSADQHSTVAQRNCIPHTSRKTADNSSFASRFVDDLFPMAQAVKQSRVASYCERFVVEFALLTVLSNALGDVAVGVLAQTVVVEKWRHRCGTQLKTVGLCALRGVFQLHPPQARAQPVCPFVFIADAGEFVTDSCLVVTTNEGSTKFFDPCSCDEYTCSGQETVSMALLESKGCAGMDPLQLVSSLNKRQSLRWPLQFHQADNATEQSRLQSAARAVNAIFEQAEYTVSDKVLKLMQQYIPDSAAYRAATRFEGPLSESDTVDYCDAIVDWWPAEWQHPPGYHVTVPCEAADTQHRTFATHFAVDRGSSPVTMRYVHDALRNHTSSQSEFGASGFCRQTTYGLSRQTLNNMRVCTRVPTSATIDEAVPLRPSGSDSFSRTNAKCSQHPSDTLWKKADSHRVNSLGILHSWVQDNRWPDTLNDGLEPGISEEVLSFGEECGLPALFTCENDVDCADAALGADATLSWQCRQRVCMLLYDSNEVCSRHDDCAEATHMCAGDGRCVQPVIDVHNEHNVAVEFNWFSDVCAGTAVDAYGSSSWGSLPDVLQGHGMCSYQRWYEYREMYRNNGCKPGEKCVLDAANVYNSHVDQQYTDDRKVFADGLLRMQAHVCDRDYMHDSRLAHCLPAQGVKVALRGETISSDKQLVDATYTAEYRTYAWSDTRHELPLLHMNNMASNGSGFLGFNASLDVESPLRCGDIVQCSPQPFTVRGHKMPTRKVLTPTGVRRYTVRDAIKCGAFGFENADQTASQCTLDLTVLPFYRIFCTDNPVGNPGIFVRQQCPLSLKEPECPAHLYNIGDRDAQRIKLNKLATLFESGFATVKQFHQLVRCAKYVRSQMAWSNDPDATQRDPQYSYAAPTALDDEARVTISGDHGMYTFSEFGQTEMPFEWWFKCFLLQGIDPGATAGADPSCGDGLLANSGNAVLYRVRDWLIQQDVVMDKSFFDTMLAAEQVRRLSETDATLASLQNALANGEDLFPQCVSRLMFKVDGLSLDKRRLLSGLASTNEDCINLDVAHEDSCLFANRKQQTNDIHPGSGLFALLSQTLKDLFEIIPLNLRDEDRDLMDDRNDLIGQSPQLFGVTWWDPFTIMSSAKLLLDNQFPNGNRKDSCLVPAARLVADVDQLCGFNSFEEDAQASLTSDIQPNLAPLVVMSAGKTTFDIQSPWAFVTAKYYPDGSSTKRPLFFENDNTALFHVCSPECKTRTQLDHATDSGVTYEKMLDNMGLSHTLTDGDVSEEIANSACFHAAHRCMTGSNGGNVMGDVQSVLLPPGIVMTHFTVDVPEFEDLSRNPAYVHVNTEQSIRLDGKTPQTVTWESAHDKLRTLPTGQSIIGQQYPVDSDSVSYKSTYETDRCPYDELYENDDAYETCFFYIDWYSGPGDPLVGSITKDVFWRDNNFLGPSIIESARELASASERSRLLAFAGTSEEMRLKATGVHREVEKTGMVNLLMQGTPPLWKWLTRKKPDGFECRRFIQCARYVECDQIECIDDANDYDVTEEEDLAFEPIDDCLHQDCVMYRTIAKPAEDEEDTYPPWLDCAGESGGAPTLTDILTNPMEYMMKYIQHYDYDWNFVLSYTHQVYLERLGYLYAERYREDARWALVMDHYKELGPQWLYNSTKPRAEISHPDRMAGYPVGLSATGKTRTGTRVIATRFQMDQPDACNAERTCTAFQWLQQVRLGYYLCLDCSVKIPTYYCEGDHDCKVSGFTNMQQLQTLLLGQDFGDGNSMRARLHTDFAGYLADGEFATTELAMEFIIRSYLQLFNHTHMPTNFTKYMPASAPRWSTKWPLAADDFSYEPSSAERWEQSIGLSSAVGSTSEGICETAGETKEVKYDQCWHNEHVEHLNAQVQSDYRHNTSLLVHARTGFSYNITRQGLLARNIPAWASTVRRSRDVYLEWIFSADRCLETTMDDSVCIVLNGTTHVVNPWTGGDFSATGQHLCDVRTNAQGRSIYDTRCATEKCGAYTPASTHPFYVGQHRGSECAAMDNRLADPLTPSAAAPGNICELSARTNATCLHPQGMLGGWDGGEVQDIYIDGQLVPFAVQSGGLFVEPRSATLREPFTTTRRSYGVVTLHGNDIAGHHLRFTLDALGVLRVKSIFAQSHASLAKAAMMLATKKTEWWAFDEQTEHEKNLLREPDQPTGVAGVSWDCPLKQRMYLSAQDARFRPTAPSARRAQVMFSHLNTDRRVHPTQDTLVGEQLSAQPMFTANGVCLCQTWAECSNWMSADLLPCSFRDTVASFKKGAAERQSRFIESAACTHAQDDWPYLGGTLRDGSTLPKTSRSADDAAECSRVQRLHEFSFQYKYVTRDHTPVDSDTLDDGGDCYMGVATEWIDRFALEHACHRSTSDAEQDEFFCRATRDAMGRPTISGTVTQKKAATPTLGELVERMHQRRARCNTCQQPPEYVVGAQAIPAEVSSGVPFRVGSDRFIAGHLRNVLTDQMCDSRAGCHELDALINTSSWVPANFWDAFLRDTAKLFKQETNSTAAVSASDLLRQQSQIPLNDQLLWAKPWIFCETVLAKCLLGCALIPNFAVCEEACYDDVTRDDAVCSGKVTASEDWVNPATRAAQCMDVLSVVSTRSAVIPNISVCDMDATMNMVCTQLQQAAYKIKNANCIVQGSCDLRTFFYQPSMYSIDNKAFVRSTVIDFYKQVSNISCPTDDSDALDLMAQNRQLRERCPSVPLELIIDVLEMLRAVVDTVVRAQYYFFMFIVNLLRSLVSPDIVEQVRTEATKWFDLFLAELSDLVKLVADFTFDFIMNLDGTIGAIFKAIFKVICIMTKFLYDVFYIQVFCPMREELLAIMIVIRDIFVAFRDISILGFKPFYNMFALIVMTFEGIVEMMQNADCDPDKSPVCNWEADDAQFENPALPITTRCWSTYTTSLGDAGSLACTAADTCRLDVGDNIVCNECPAVEDTDALLRFGCHAALKMCRCSVLKSERTPCISHQECLPTSNSMCDIIDTGFEATAFGTLACSSCSSVGVCLMSLNDMTGYCACSQQQLQFQGCAMAGVGQSVMPAAEKLCLATLGASAQQKLSTSAVYSTEYNSLAAVPCVAVDRSKVFCYKVYRGMTDYSSYAVAVNTLWETASGRRLLEGGEPWRDAALLPTTLSGFLRMSDFFNIDAARLHDVTWGDWSGVRSEACSFVPQMRSMNESSMAVSDRMLLLECVRRRSVGQRVVHLFDLQGVVPDTVFLSLNDFAHALQDPAVIAAMIRRPQMLVMAALHSPHATPLRSAIRAGRVWLMHTMLEMQQVSSTMVEELASNDNGTLCSMLHTLGGQQHCNASLALSQSTNGLFFVTHWLSRVFGLSRASATQPLEMPVRSEHGLNVHVKEAHIFMQTATRRRPATHRQRAPRAKEAEAVPHQLTVPSATPVSRRQLLNFIDRIASTQTYTVDVVLGDGATQILSGEVAAVYTSGPISWPPQYAYWDGSLKCAPLTNVVELTLECATLLWLYYDKSNVDRPTRPTIHRELSYAFDGFQLTTVGGDAEERESALSDSYMAQLVRSLLRLVGVKTANVRAFVVTAPDVLRNFFICDVASVMFCSEQHHSLVNSVIAMAATCLVLIIVSSFFGMTFVTSLVVLGFISMTMFYAFGYSPLCAPMLPTCLMEELTLTVSWLIPERIEWPASIQRNPDCANNVSSNASMLGPLVSECIIPCSEYPFMITSWEDVVLFTICDLSVAACDSTVTAIRLFGDVMIPSTVAWHQRVLDSATWKRQIVSVADPDMLTGYRYCAIVSSWMLAVPVAVIFVVSMLLSAIVSLLATAALQTVNIIVGVAIVSHTNQS
jgi:hypothetical protein